MRKILLTIIFACSPMVCFAQSTTVSGQVTDAGSQSWNNGTVSFSFVPAPNQNIKPSVWTGGAFNPTQTIITSLNSSGAYSVSIPSNTAISPAGSSWTICATPQATSPPFCSTQAVTGGTQTINLTPPAISIGPGPGSVVYATSEISAAVIGSQTYLLGTGLEICSAVSGNACITWGSAGGGAAPNSPLPLSSGPGPVFNVVNYGAVNDALSTAQGACTSAATTTMTCTGAGFVQARDAGKTFFCSNGTSSFYTALTTIVSVTDSTHVVTSNASLFNTFTCTAVWGTLNDTAVAAAATAAIAQSSAVQSGGKKLPSTGAPTLYSPAGGYLFCTLLVNGVVNLTGTVDGFTVLGDGRDQTIWYAGSGATPCPLTNNSSLGAFVNTGGSTTNITIKGITFDGANNANTNQSAGLGLAGAVNLQDVTVQRWGSGGPAVFLGGQHFVDRLFVVAGTGIGIQCTACNADLNNIGTSNNGTSSANLIFQNIIGSATGYGVRVRGGSIVDECGNNATGCTQLINSRDVWFEGLAAFGTPSGHCLNVDANSYLHWIGGICGTFNNDTNTGGPVIANGGVIQASDVRMISTGTGKCLTNNGQFNDNGGNTCESMFQIVSGTSTGTSAVLTLTTLGANASTNCSVGDSIEVDGAGVAGYNGFFQNAITATGASSLTYTSVGSNMGALGAGGVAYCKNLQTYSGTLPKALLNNPIPNTCYVTGTFGATVTGAPMCAFKTQSATNITNIKAASTTVTACTVAPVVTISDGTATVTLTLTTAKSLWDSSVDTSTGVGTTIFKPNGTIQVTNTVGTCTTPPTNFSVSYNISPILSN
jgi:hypothetical protein